MELEPATMQLNSRSPNNSCVRFHCIYIHPGYLNLGDQILVCDGVSLLDVTHDEAAEALKKAMDMESVIEHFLLVIHYTHKTFIFFLFKDLN